MNDPYYKKYIKYKTKYINLKRINLKGGAITSMKTEENEYVSYEQVPYSSINKDMFTTDMKIPHPDKILLINSSFLFDIFTNKYGDLYPYFNKYFEGPDVQIHRIFIKWNKVATDYKGFYLDTSDEMLRLLRMDYAYINNMRMPSWWLDNYNFTGVLLFV